MAYLISQLYPWILVSLLSGIMVGAFLYTPHERVSAIALTTCALLLALGLAAAWTAVVPGRMGLSLDILLTMALPYGFGWILGDGLRRRSVKRNTVQNTLAPVVAMTDPAPVPAEEPYLAFARAPDQPAGEPQPLAEGSRILAEEQRAAFEGSPSLAEEPGPLAEEPHLLDEEPHLLAHDERMLLISSPETSPLEERSEPPWSPDDQPIKSRRRPGVREA